MRALLASPLGLLIGLSLGALGGGGSILAVPALVYAAGQSPKEATSTSLVLVAITAVIGIVPHWRAGRVRVVPGLLFGLAGIGGSLLGSAWNERVDQDVLLLAFAGLMLVAAWAMWRRVQRSTERTPPTPLAVGAAVATPHHGTDTTTVVKVLLAGSLVGLLTGFFGVGGGFVIVPALVLALRFTMTEAAATSLLVIAINAVVALGSRLDGGALDWAAIVPFTIASLIGVVIGGRLAGRVDANRLQRWFVFLLVAVALYTAGSSLVALT